MLPAPTVAGLLALVSLVEEGPDHADNSRARDGRRLDRIAEPEPQCGDAEGPKTEGNRAHLAKPYGAQISGEGFFLDFSAVRSLALPLIENSFGRIRNELPKLLERSWRGQRPLPEILSHNFGLSLRSLILTCRRIIPVRPP